MTAFANTRASKWLEWLSWYALAMLCTWAWIKAFVDYQYDPKPGFDDLGASKPTGFLLVLLLGVSFPLLGLCIGAVTRRFGWVKSLGCWCLLLLYLASPLLLQSLLG